MARLLWLLLLLPLGAAVALPEQQQKQQQYQQQQKQSTFHAPTPPETKERRVLTDFKAAAETMQTVFFDFSVGAWPRAIDWTSAVLGTLLAATSATLTVPDIGLADRYFAELVAFYYGQHSESLKTQAYDDMLWGGFFFPFPPGVGRGGEG